MGFPHTSIRIGSVADAETIAALAIQVFLDTYAAEGVRPELANEAFTQYGQGVFVKRLQELGRVFYLAERGAGLVGFAEVLRNNAASPIKRIFGSELVRLYVQPQVQGLGIGRALIKEAENCAKQAGSAGLWLSAWEHNARALEFYKRLNYEDVGLTHYVFQGHSFGNRVLYKSIGNNEV